MWSNSDFEPSHYEDLPMGGMMILREVRNGWEVGDSMIWKMLNEAKIHRLH